MDMLIEKTLVDACLNELSEYANSLYNTDNDKYEYLWGLIDRICLETQDEKNEEVLDAKEAG